MGHLLFPTGEVLRLCDRVRDGLALSPQAGAGGGAVCAQPICIALILASMLLYADGSTVLGSAPLRYSLLFLPTTVALVWLVASCTGTPERLWSPAWVQWIAGLSPYAFLIHGVVLKYTRKLFAVAFPAVPALAVAAVALAITLACSAGWRTFIAGESKSRVREHNPITRTNNE